MKVRRAACSLGRKNARRLKKSAGAMRFFPTEGFCHRSFWTMAQWCQRPVLPPLMRNVPPTSSSLALRSISTLQERTNRHTNERVISLKNLWGVLLSTLLATVTTISVAFSLDHHDDSDSTTRWSSVFAFLFRQPEGSPSVEDANREPKKRGVPEPGKPYEVSVRAIRGNRFYMEDEFFVTNGGRFAAVFDGHGGSGVSQYLRENLFSAVDNHLQDRQQRKGSSSASEEENQQQVPSIPSYMEALRAGFDKVANEVLQDDDFEFQGSTAVAVVLHESADGRRTFLTANVGDSRAVLSRKGTAVDLTRDHKPSDEKEKARLAAMGEEPEWDEEAEIYRVSNLSVSRSVGDRYAGPAVSCEAEIQQIPIVEGDDEFIVIASDGLWDVMTSQEVVEYVHHRMKKELSGMSKEKAEKHRSWLRKNMAKNLVREAMKRGTADNVCVLMVWLF